MTITQLITLLQDCKEHYGDLKVAILTGTTPPRFMEPVPLKEESLKVYPPQYNDSSIQPTLLELVPIK